MAKGKPTKRAMDPEIEEALKVIHKQFGDGAVVLASEGDALDIPRIRTGNFMVDYVSGGGIPRGKIIILWGPQQGGKSVTAMSIVVAMQSHCRECGEAIDEDEKGKTSCSCKGKKPVPMRGIWNDAEGIWSNSWAEDNGVDLDRLHVIRVAAAEDGIDIAKQLLSTSKFDFLVIDSIAHLAPAKELEDSMSKAQPGGLARLVNRMLREFVARQTEFGGKDGRAPTIILINQEREKIGVMFGSPITRPGGKGMDFASSLDFHFLKAKKTFLDEEGKEIAEKTARQKGIKPAYIDVRFHTNKNRVFCAGLDGGYRFYVSNGPVDKKTGEPMWQKGVIDDFEWVWQYAQLNGLISHSSKSWTCGKLTASSKPALKDALASSEEDLESLKDTLLSMLL